MKRSIFSLTLSMIIGGTMLTSCQSSREKVENAQEQVVEAKQELNQAIKDSIQQFRMESEEKIRDNEKDIAEFNAKIAKQKKEDRARYEQKLADLQKQNREMKKQLENFREESKDNWDAFRFKFKNDMDDLGKAMKGFWDKK